jgi:hypothetical protein
MPDSVLKIYIVLKIWILLGAEINPVSEKQRRIFKTFPALIIDVKV